MNLETQIILLNPGLPDLPIQLNSSRLRAKSKQEEHPFDLSEIADLPLAIQNPLAVFRSATDIGSYVYLQIFLIKERILLQLLRLIE